MNTELVWGVGQKLDILLMTRDTNEIGGNSRMKETLEKILNKKMEELKKEHNQCRQEMKMELKALKIDIQQIKGFGKEDRSTKTDSKVTLSSEISSDIIVAADESSASRDSNDMELKVAEKEKVNDVIIDRLDNLSSLVIKLDEENQRRFQELKEFMKRATGTLIVEEESMDSYTLDSP